MPPLFDGVPLGYPVKNNQILPNLLKIPEKSRTFAVVEPHGPVVQWIEYKIPVLTIWVRIPSGSQTPIAPAAVGVFLFPDPISPVFPPPLSAADGMNCKNTKKYRIFQIIRIILLIFTFDKKISRMTVSAPRPGRRTAVSAPAKTRQKTISTFHKLRLSDYLERPYA